MKARLSDRAADDLADRLMWYNDRSPRKSEEFADAFEAALAVIEENPQALPLAEDAPPGYDVRYFWMPRFKHRVVYHMRDDAIVIIAIDRGRKRPGWWHTVLDG